MTKETGKQSNKRRTLRNSWKLPRYKKDWCSICAILPKYLADGTNGTVIYYIDGSIEEVENRLVYVLDDLLGYLNTSKDILHKRTEFWLEENGVKRVPLVVDKNFCLVPVKGRAAVSEGDGVKGYVVLACVQNVQCIDGETLVYLAENNTIAVLDSLRTLKRNLMLASELVKQVK